MTLRDCALKFGVDKLHSHSYIPFYEQLFKGRNVRRLLEIGVGYRELMEPFVPFFVPGASLKMWEEYFPEADIFACDIRPDTLINEGRIHSWQCDQTNADDLVKLMTEIGKISTGGRRFLDVILDDGSHEIESQIFTAEHLFDFIRDGSVYIVEDCRDPERFVKEFGTGQIVRFNKRPDDCLIIIVT